MRHRKYRQSRSIARPYLAEPALPVRKRCRENRRTSAPGRELPCRPPTRSTECRRRHLRISSNERSKLLPRLASPQLRRLQLIAHVGGRHAQSTRQMPCFSWVCAHAAALVMPVISAPHSGCSVMAGSSSNSSTIPGAESEAARRRICSPSARSGRPRPAHVSRLIRSPAR